MIVIKSTKNVNMSKSSDYLKVKSFLAAKPGYTKVGFSKVASRLGVNPAMVRQVISELGSSGKMPYKRSPKAIRSDIGDFDAFLRPQYYKGKESVAKGFKKPYAGNKNNTLVIGDLHEPFTRDGYEEFCRDVQEEFDCGSVMFIGDIIDGHAVCYHDHDPDGMSPGHELQTAATRLKKWYAMFPEAKLCYGNHDLLYARKMYTAGLPSGVLKSLPEVLQCPRGWQFDFHHVLNGVFYTHGTGVSGDNGAMKIANQNRQSTVIGHLHSTSNIKYAASYKDIIFGMIVGCGIDRKEYAFNYGRDLPAKPIINCGVVLSGKLPILIPMEL